MLIIWKSEMENILYINSCPRENSRTKDLAEHLLSKLNGQITEVNLYKNQPLPLDEDTLNKRSNLIENGIYDDKMFNLANQFANADIIVISAPFWDLLFPAVLRCYIENITVNKITFCYSEEGRPVGLCKAKRLYYITTSGGYIGNDNLGFNYIKALSEKFFGINDVTCFTAEGLDIIDADIDTIIQSAKNIINNSLEQ